MYCQKQIEQYQLVLRTRTFVWPWLTVRSKGCNCSRSVNYEWSGPHLTLKISSSPCIMYVGHSGPPQTSTTGRNWNAHTRSQLQPIRAKFRCAVKTHQEHRLGYLLWNCQYIMTQPTGFRARLLPNNERHGSVDRCLRQVYSVFDGEWSKWHSGREYKVTLSTEWLSYRYNIGAVSSGLYGVLNSKRFAVADRLGGHLGSLFTCR